MQVLAWHMFYLEEEESFEECIHALLVGKKKTTCVYEIEHYSLALQNKKLFSIK